MKQASANFFELKGTNYEIGKQLGYMVLDNPYLKEIFISSSNTVEKDKKHTYELFDKYCPGLNEELQGFADILGTERSRLVFVYLTYLAPACSQMVVLPSKTKNRHVLLARNYDYSEQTDDFCLSKTTVTGKYSHIGSNIMQFGRGEGMNECGLVVSQSSCGRPVNSYPTGKQPKVVGLQFWAIVRTLLENCKNVKEALDTLSDMPTACNINLMVADKHGEAALIEIMDGRKEVKLVKENTDADYLIATNHIHISSMVNMEPYAMKNSIIRYRCLKEWITQNSDVDEQKLKELLLTPYPDGLMLPFYEDYFGTIKSIVFNLTLGKIDICWGGLETNRWHSFNIDDSIESKTCLQNINKQPTATDFFDIEPIEGWQENRGVGGFRNHKEDKNV